jgi:ribosomal protein S18 acetylase RimI-like enzyme
MIDVTLVPMTVADLDEFIGEQIADYADECVHDGSWSPRGACQRARSALDNVVSWEHQAMTASRQRLWTAINASGERVGWLWVKLAPPGPAVGRAFLCQMTVSRALRCQGYGRAMLAALETRLTSEGVAQLELNVCEANLPAKRLYAGAGFECTARHPTMRQLRKRLVGKSVTTIATAKEVPNAYAPV